MAACSTDVLWDPPIVGFESFPIVRISWPWRIKCFGSCPVGQTCHAFQSGGYVTKYKHITEVVDPYMDPVVRACLSHCLHVGGTMAQCMAHCGVEAGDLVDGGLLGSQPNNDEAGKCECVGGWTVTYDPNYKFDKIRKDSFELAKATKKIIATYGDTFVDFSNPDII